ncbi:roquin-1 isoform X2 [Aricia agestis]|uniref:roquin-1 isoform X2 n=1 Tax=Aricia agestis TaxID=91739 RepID=UPI001C20ABB4|nr:roquin-1 isoform X2 [Aricia agestis]
MPIQAPQWTDYLNCPVCCREFGPPPRSPISLGCGHTLCGHCLKHLHRKQCPFDQTVIQSEPEELVVNTALLKLVGYTPPAQPYHPPCIQALPEHERQAYDVIVRCLEHLAIYLKLCSNAGSNLSGNRLSRPMQRKLVTLLQCAVTDEEGRGRAARAARSLGERTVTELILQHQNPQQLSANLWAAVRARGCQFLGPAMQEEVLKLVLLALEDGSALSRKVLVMFVVQRLEPHFPQASKTSIGHVVQLLYRASCFKVSKRECDSSLMQLKEEFRTYESLRREHDAQIVQIATEAGLRIAPDQWSALLYGDTAHKSHMQSIIDKLQTPQSFAQSVQELFIALQRTGDPAQLIAMSMHLDRLANIDASPDAESPTWQQLAEIINSIKEVVSGLVHYLQQANCRDTNHNQKHVQDRTLEPSTSQPSPQNAAMTPTHARYKTMCRYRGTNNSGQEVTNGNFQYMPGISMPMPPAMPQPMMPQMYPAMPYPPAPHIDNFNVPNVPPLRQYPAQGFPQEPYSEFPPDNRTDCIQNANFPSSNVVHNAPPMNQNGLIVPIPERPYYGRFNDMSLPEDNMKYPRPEFVGPVYPVPRYPAQEAISPMPNMFMPVQHEAPRNVSPYNFDDLPCSGFPAAPCERRMDPTWAPANNVFNFDEIRSTLPPAPNSDEVYLVPDRWTVGADRLTAVTNRADDELEEELQALERRIDTEFKSAD